MADVGSVATGIYQPLQPPQQQQMTPLGMLQIIGQLQSNNIQRQELQSRQAIGDVWKNSIDPTTGKPDPVKLRALLPTTGWYAPEAVQQGITNESAATDLDSKYQQTISQGIAELATHASITPLDISRLKQRLAAQGVPGKVVTGTFASMPDDPDALKQWAITHSNLARGTEAIAKGITIPDKKGTPYEISEGAASRARAGGGLQTGMAPGFTAAQEATGAGSGAALNEARQRGLNYRQEVYPLEQAIPALEKLGKTGTGPGTEEFNHVKSFLQSAGIPGFDADKIKNFDEAKKYLTDFVNQNGNTGTNDKLAAAFAGNPSVGVSNAAAVDVAKSALALRRMKQAQLIEFEKSGLPDSEYTKWASQWNIGHDPRAFGFDLMSVPQRNAVLNSISDKKAPILDENGKPKLDKSGKPMEGISPRELFKLQVAGALGAGIIKTPVKKTDQQ